MFKNWRVWPFLLACFVILTLTVLLVPQGTGRFIGAGVAALVFPIFPLVTGMFGSKSLNDKNGRVNVLAWPVLLLWMPCQECVAGLIGAAIGLPLALAMCIIIDVRHGDSFWEAVHNVVGGLLMVIAGRAAWAKQFYHWTANKARQEAAQIESFQKESITQRPATFRDAEIRKRFNNL